MRVDANELIDVFAGGDAPPGGVVHVTAVWRAARGVYRTIAIGEHAPPSPVDAALLDLARARADAIVTTGAILRAEPDVRHALRSAAAEPLAAWRRERLGKTDPPWSLVLTSGRELDLDHPLIRSAPRALVFTTHAAAARLAARARDPHATFAGTDRPDLRSAIAHLRRERDAETVVVEAGPTTAAALYAAPVAVDELLLSIYLEPELHAAAIGPPAVGPEAIAAAFGGPLVERRATQPSGRWLFRRYRR